MARPVAAPSVETEQAGAPPPVPRDGSAAVRPAAVKVAVETGAPIRPATISTATRPIPLPRDASPMVRPEEEDEEHGELEPTERAIKAAPPWLVSLVVHMIVLIVLALLSLPGILDNKVVLEVFYAEKLGEQLLDDTLQMAQLEPLEITDPILSKDITPADDPLAAPPEIDFMIEATSAASEIEAPSIGLALTGREKGMKKALLDAYGGTATTEAAVKRGLEWLKRNQQQDGSWSLQGPYDSGGFNENKMAATAMALLAFQGAGNTHRSGEYKDVVNKAWKWMLRQQDPDGSFVRDVGGNHMLYTQAQATIAICELYGMTKDSQFKDPAQKALDYAFDIQAPEGGWRYTPRYDSDTSVTGWFVMALQSGLMAGLIVETPALENISKYLDRATTDGGSQYAYKPGGDERLTMTAEALLCRQYLGWSRDDPRLTKGVAIVGDVPVDFNDMNVYYWYYATQVMHHMGGEDWDRWNRVMREAVPRNQVVTGRESGSWSPVNDQWGNHGGRLYTTCLCIYLLEVYYRHLPIYKYRLH